MFGPHETNLAWGRDFSERHVAYYGARAAGGCGTLVTETASVHETDWPYERCPDATNFDALVAGWAKVAQAGQQHGSLVIGSLGHSGGQGSSAYSQRELWAPSDEPDVDSRETPKIMELQDISAVVGGFALGAKAASVAGVDGVEINAGQHSLIRQFFSGLTNRRDDAYAMGTDPLRFAREVLAAVRAELSYDQILGLRLSCDEMAPWAGVTPERAAEIAGELAGMVDYIVVVRGSIFTAAATRPDAHEAPGFNIDLASAIANAVWDAAPSVAVFAQGSIVDVDQAESALEDAKFDGVEMTRAQIAEPELVSKLIAGNPGQIRPCVLCNQLCMVRDNRNPIVSCIGNPDAGFEFFQPAANSAGNTGGVEPIQAESSPAINQSQVLVIGGGPAGLEAARVAAQRGASVRLVEASPELGGMVKVAAAAPGRERLGMLTKWLESECRRLGVTIGAGTRATPDLIARFTGELIMATGSRARIPEYVIDPEAISLTAAEALTGSITFGEGPIAVWDPVGGLTGIAVAEFLAKSNKEVVVITTDQVVGTQLSRTGDLAGSNVRLQQAGVTIVKRSRVLRVGESQIEVQDVFTNEVTSVHAVALVDAGHRLSNEYLLNTVLLNTVLRKTVHDVASHVEARHRGSDSVVPVGDLVAPRTIAEAIREGRAAGLAAAQPRTIAVGAK